MPENRQTVRGAGRATFATHIDDKRRPPARSTTLPGHPASGHGIVAPCAADRPAIQPGRLTGRRPRHRRTRRGRPTPTGSGAAEGMPDHFRRPGQNAQPVRSMWPVFGSIVKLAITVPSEAPRSNAIASPAGFTFITFQV